MRKITIEQFRDHLGEEIQKLPLIITKRGVNIAIVNFVNHSELDIQPDGLKLNHPIQSQDSTGQSQDSVQIKDESQDSTGQQFDKKLPTIELTPTKKVKQLPKFCPKHKTCQRQGNSYSCGCKI